MQNYTRSRIPHEKTLPKERFEKDRLPKPAYSNVSEITSESRIVSQVSESYT